MALIIPFEGKTPQIDPTAWVAPNATLIGDVRIGPGASVWFGAVLRGDMDRIELGAGSNLQDNVVVHTDAGVPTIIGENVGVGHLAFVAAGALVLERQEVEAGHLVAGVPAKDRGPMNEAMAERVRSNAFGYQELSAKYRDAGV